MSAQPRTNTIDQELERELARRLQVARAENKPAEVLIAGTRYRLVPVEDDDVHTTDDPAAGYDVQRALAAIDAGAGAFKGLDVAAFLADMLEAREQDTPSHRF